MIATSYDEIIVNYNCTGLVFIYIIIIYTYIMDVVVFEMGNYGTLSWSEIRKDLFNITENKLT